MQIRRTPDERFKDLPDYDFAPQYSEVPDGEGGVLRIHHVDEGPPDAAPVLLIHGQPTWSYLYRKMIPILAEAGHRVIAPDLVGFGRSDKPTERSDYTYARHVQWMSDWLVGLDIRDATLFCQDWGGLIGLRLVAAFPERFARVVAANTGMPYPAAVPEEALPAIHKLYDELPVVKLEELGEKFAATDGPPGFLYWKKFCAETPELPIGDLIGSVARFEYSDEVRAAYEAPFPDDSYCAGAHIFPSLVPILADDPELPANGKAWESLSKFDKPFLTAFSDSDPVTAGGEKILQERIAGAKGQNHVTIANAGHFLQEDRGEECAAAILTFIRDTPN